MDLRSKHIVDAEFERVVARNEDAAAKGIVIGILIFFAAVLFVGAIAPYIR